MKEEHILRICNILASLEVGNSFVGLKVSFTEVTVIYTLW